jgi:DNA-binding LytR/AlgR family response regulator
VKRKPAGTVYLILKTYRMQAAFFVRLNGKLTAVFFDDILYITAKNNYSEIVTTKKKFFVYMTLGWLEEHLPQNHFCRVHRSHIIAVQKIIAFDHHEVEVEGQKISINKAGFESILKRVLVFSN